METIRARKMNFRNVDREVYFSVGLGLKSAVGRSCLGTPSCDFHGCVQPSFLHSPFFSHRSDFNIRTLTRPAAIVGHGELMMMKGTERKGSGNTDGQLAASPSTVWRDERSRLDWSVGATSPEHTYTTHTREECNPCPMTHPLPVYDALQFSLPNFIQGTRKGPAATDGP